MTQNELNALLKKIGIPFAHHHWEKPPRPPYGVYLFEGTENFGADNITYAVIEQIALELYTVDRSEADMKRLEDVLEQAELFWDRDTEYIQELRLFQTRYEIEV